MAEVAPEDVAEVQAHANAAIMQAHTTIRQEIPAGTLQQSFISYVETMVHKIMSEFVAYGRLTKAKAIELYQQISNVLNPQKLRLILDCVTNGGTAISSLYMGREIIGWITNPRTLLSFLGAADLFVDGVGLGIGAAASLEGVLVAIFVAIAVLAVIVIIGHVTNNFEEAYLYFKDGFKSHSGYFRQWHEKIFGKVLGDDIYDVSDIAISARGLFEIKYLAPDELVQSFGLTIQRLLDKTHRAWHDLSRTAFVSEIAADVNTVSGHVEDAYDWVKEQFSSNQKEDKKHG
ncbi:hypothetical protein [Celerinatantimonas diazotrophica]|uniref:Uncharacterized protein n=1 Tax=Celerinatantimonas diazotrophica TaxID=412034 RepID=A0A4R1KK07_9GAMM|nr:hypothetical protein [Celerinatantimonas diazotrophica]TCK63979.1 hypothetical protein EV690_0095 [Celerinatantimonas diazotrophica]CAG9297066.1 hypothetical protein CEDIAZO_02228 [Celerinatantimonas diazotrophica]